MAATNYTPIQLYYSTTASAAPSAGNLTSGELAINITDGKLYYKDNGGVVQVIATKGAGTIGGSTTQIQYNNAGALAGSAAMTFNSGTNTVTLTTLNLTNALGATYGGTAQSAYAQGDVLYASATNTLSKLGIGTVNYILTSTGSVPQWSAPSSITVQTATNLAGGAGGSVPYQSAADTTTFLAIGAANRVMTSSGSAPQWVTALTGLTGVSSSSITNTSLTSTRLVYSSTAGLQADSANLTFDGTTLSATGYSTTGLSTLVKTVTIGNSNFSGTSVFAAATPAKLYVGTGTVTDTTSAIGATNATGAISSLAITPIAATNTSVTYTNASTLYIAGAPSAGTNITITNPYALYVAAGAAYFGGSVNTGALTVSSLTDSGLTSGRVTYASTGGLLVDSGNLTFSGQTLSVANSAATTGPSAVSYALTVSGGNNMGGTIGANGEAYAINTQSAKYQYFQAGTIAAITASANSVNSGCLIDFNAYNSANGATGIFLGAVAGSATNGAANFVIGRRTGTSNWAESLRIDTAGFMSIGGTPNAWNANFKGFQGGSAGYGSFVVDNSNGYAEIYNNSYASGATAWTYIASLGATRYSQQLGSHVFYTAGAGTGGAAITWNTAATITSGGLNLPTAASGNANISFDGSTFTLVANSSSAPMVFATNSTERMRLFASTGNLVVGTTTTTDYGDKISAVYGSSASLGANDGGISVRNSGAATQIRISRLGSAYSYLGVTGPGSMVYSYDSLYFVADTSSNMYWSAGNSLKLALLSSGNFGVGSTSPSTNLVIGGTAAGSGASGGLGVFLSRGVTTNFYEAYDGTKSYIAGVDNTLAYAKAGTLSGHDLGIITGNGIKIYVKNSNGGVTIGSTTTATTSGLRTEGTVNPVGGIVADAVLSGYVAVNYTGTRYWLIDNMTDYLGAAIHGQGLITAASYTAWNLCQIWFRREYNSTNCYGGITGFSKSSTTVSLVDITYNSKRYLAIAFAGGDPGISCDLNGYRLNNQYIDGVAQFINGTTGVTVNSTIASY